MNFDEYQKRANSTNLESATLGEVMAQRNLNTIGFLDKVMGISGEAGEVSERVKKILRDKGGEFDETDRTNIAKELGDVLWYVAETALYLDLPLSQVAEMNLAKLADRAARGKLHGEGDER